MDRAFIDALYVEFKSLLPQTLKLLNLMGVDTEPRGYSSNYRAEIYPCDRCTLEYWEDEFRIRVDGISVLRTRDDVQIRTWFEHNLPLSDIDWDT